MQCASFLLWWFLLLGLLHPRAQAQWLWHIGLAAPWHVESSQTRDQTRVPCIVRRILIHCTTGGNYILFPCLIYQISCPQTEKAMAIHSSTLAWKIPWTEEPGGLQSMGSLRVGHDRAYSLSLFTFMHWRRKWQPTPVFLPGESQGRGSLVGCRLWGRTELGTTEVI